MAKAPRYVAPASASGDPLQTAEGIRAALADVRARERFHRAMAATLARQAEELERIQKGRFKRHRSSPMQAKAVRYLMANANAGYAALAGHLYGAADDATMNAARVLMAKMRENRIVSGSPGIWKVLRPEAGGGVV